MSAGFHTQFLERHQRILDTPADPQASSPLFSTIPAEIRHEIFKYALTDYPDPLPAKQYNASTCYTRPAYSAPFKSDTQILRTCRAVYVEAWFMPFILLEHVHFATHTNRRPPEHRSAVLNWSAELIARSLSSSVVAAQSSTEPEEEKDEEDDDEDISNDDSGEDGPSAAARIRREINLARIRRRRAAMETSVRRTVEVERMRVYAQMYKLEEGDLNNILIKQRLLPRIFTLTIRHADWWYWEDDNPLSFSGNWIGRLASALPSTVTEFNIEMETLARKKAQLDEIAKQMMDKWFIRREDGAVLYADSKTESSWRGTSTWHQQRWIRDETSPGVIDYYVVAVTFRLENVILRKGGTVSPAASANSKRARLSDKHMKLHRPEWVAMRCSNPYERVNITL